MIGGGDRAATCPEHAVQNGLSAVEEIEPQNAASENSDVYWLLGLQPESAAEPQLEGTVSPEVE